MNKLATCLLLILLMTSIANADGKIKLINSWTDLPPSISTQLQSHIRQRLGDDLYHKLHIQYGQLHLTDQGQPRWASMVVGFQLTELGINLVYGTLAVDANGQIIRELTMPCLTQFPERTIQISRQQALQVAATNGGLRLSDDFERYDWCQIVYSARIGFWTWEISEPIGGNGNTVTNHIYSVNASTGEFIGMRTEAVRY